MRKLVFFFLMIIFTAPGLHAQKDSAFASVRYTFTHLEDTSWPENPLKMNMVLLLGKSISNYTDFDRLEDLKKSGRLPGSLPAAGTVSVSADLPPDILAGITVGGDYYKNNVSGILSYMAFTNGKVFSVDENIPVINWNIKPETKEIMGMQCQKATCDFKGRSYEAWFTSQLPYSNGPWKLGGLPGLIVQAYDTKKEVMFDFVSFENASGRQVPIEIHALASKTTVKEYKQYLDALAKDREALAGSAAASGRITVVGKAPLGPDGKPKRFRKKNNPIEKENNN